MPAGCFLKAAAAFLWCMLRAEQLGLSTQQAAVTTLALETPAALILAALFSADTSKHL